MIMSRPARILSKTGMYHIVFRGIGRQNLFEEERDYKKMLEIIGRVKNEFSFDLYAYCLMSNHVHFFIKEKNPGDIKSIMHKILSIYAAWFNYKYQRCGSLVGNRYKSEPVENERYFLALLRYIHQNPLRANSASTLTDCLWSSYNHYISNNAGGIVDMDLALNMFAEDRKTAINEFAAFHNIFESEDFELSGRVRPTDAQLKRKMLELSGVEKLTDIAPMDRKRRNLLLRDLKEHGFSIRDIERLTGVSRGVIQRA